MERRDFLKRLGLVSAVTVIPISVIASLPPNDTDIVPSDILHKKISVWSFSQKRNDAVVKSPYYKTAEEAEFAWFMTTTIGGRDIIEKIHNFSYMTKFCLKGFGGKEKLPIVDLPTMDLVKSELTIADLLNSEPYFKEIYDDNVFTMLR